MEIRCFKYIKYLTLTYMPDNYERKVPFDKIFYEEGEADNENLIEIQTFQYRFFNDVISYLISKVQERTVVDAVESYIDDITGETRKRSLTSGCYSLDDEHVIMTTVRFNNGDIMYTSIFNAQLREEIVANYKDSVGNNIKSAQYKKGFN